MRRYGRVAGVLVALFLCLNLASCRPRDFAPRLWLEALCTSLDGLPAGELYDSNAEEGENGYLEPSLIRLMYGDGAQEDLAGCRYAVYQSSFADPTELAVFWAPNRSAARQVAMLCLRRIEEIHIAWKGSDFESWGKEATVLVQGRYVAMGILEDASAFRREAEKRLP